jgi:hypothetical protein
MTAYFGFPRFLLDDMFPVDERVLPIIKCLIRIAYHSEAAALVIVNIPLLLEKLFAICSLPSESGKQYTAKLLILFRVIASRSQEFAEILCTRFNLVPFLLSIIGDSVVKTTTASQSIYLWHVLLYHGIAVESISEFTAVLFTLLSQLASRSTEGLENGDIVLSNALVTLLIFLFEKYARTVEFLRPTLENLSCQWLTLFASGTQNSRSFIKLISNSIYLLSCTMYAEKNEFVGLLFKILKWDSLMHLSKRLQDASYLLNAVKTNYIESLPSLCVPTCILVADNNFLIIHAVVKCLLQNECFGNCEEHVTIIDNIWQSYVIPLLNRTNLNEIAVFWPARMEILFLYDILFLTARQKSPSVNQQRQLLRLAFALLRVIHTDDSMLIEPIFSQILFNEYLQNLFTSSSCDTIEKFDEVSSSQESNVRYLDMLKKIFADQLNVPNTKTILMSTKRGTECVMPTDWFYVPILKISNAFQDDKRKYCLERQDESAVRMIGCILKWIRFVEYIADDVQTNMSLSTRFCRVCCVFFCGDTFLELRDLLSDILRLLLKRNDELDFSKAIPGLSSFYDFYRELCEQFASCSYGDQVFGLYLLVPLQQKHDVRLRLYFWSEQTAVLRFLTISNEQLFVPFDSYLRPKEENVQMIETYLNIIARG